MSRSRRQLAGWSLAAASGACCVTGCHTEHLGVPGPGIVSAVALDYAATALPHGPRVTFVNESNLTISIRYWSGRRDTSAPRGVADLRTSEHQNIRATPGDFFITQMGRSWWPTSMSDAVIYARLDATDANGGTRGPIWIELEQPQPYKFAAKGDSLESLELRRFGGGAISPMPRDLWIDGNNGPLPVYETSLSAR